MATCLMCRGEPRRPRPGLFWTAMAIYAGLCFGAPSLADALAPHPAVDTLLRATPFILLAFVLPIVGRGPSGRAAS